MIKDIGIEKLVLVIVLLLDTGFLYAQVGGKKVFEFLNLPANGRSAALGGVVVSATDSDAAMFLSNPGLLNEDTHHHLSLSHVGFYADVKFSTAAYARKFERIGILGIGIQHIAYGELESYDPSGNPLGKFNANETALTLSKSHTLKSFTLGANLKLAQSSIYTFSASALLLDIGGVYHHPEKELSIGMNIKNFGLLLSDYSAANSSDLPLDLQLGLTFKPEYMPFRFTFTAYNINRDGVTFFDQDVSEADNKPGQVDKIFRHISIGTELLLGKGFHLRAGYNHLLRKELSLRDTAGGSGISFGLMLRIKAFELAYTNTTYHASGCRSFFSLSTNLNRMLNRKEILNKE